VLVDGGGFLFLEDGVINFRQAGIEQGFDCYLYLGTVFLTFAPVEDQLLSFQGL
jgi:hypothetical protein